PDRARDAGIEPPCATPVAAQRDALEKRERVAHGQLHHVADALPVHQYREALGLEPLAAARRARLLQHELSQLLAHAVGRRLAVAALDVLQDPVPSRFVLAVPLFAVVLERELPARR